MALKPGTRLGPYEILALIGGSVTTRGQAAFLVWQAGYSVGCVDPSSTTEVDGGFEVLGVQTMTTGPCTEDQSVFRIFVDPAGETSVPPEPEEVMIVMTCEP